MRVAYDPMIFWEQRYGGISRYFVQIIKFLQSSDDVVIPGPGLQNEYTRELAPALIQESAIINMIDRLPNRIRYRSNRLKDMLTKCALEKWNPDIVHETYYRKLRCAPKSTAVILTVYDMVHERFQDTFAKNDPTIENKRAAVDRADHIICISEATKQDLIEYLGVSPDRVSVVLLGFDRFSTPSLDDAGLDDSRPYILYVGQRHTYKNFSRFVEAFASSRALKRDFRIVAFGGPDFRSQELSFFGSMGLDMNHIRWISGSDALLATYYKHAAAFVYPSLYEGFGLPPLEAMAQGCPVAASDRSSIPEVLGDAAVYFDPYSPDSIRTSIESLVYDSELRINMIQKGSSRLDLFSWEKCALETRRVYSRFAP